MKSYNFIRQVISECSRTDALVYIILMTFNGKGKCFPTRQSIASLLNMKSNRSITKILSRLEKKGLLKRNFNPGRCSNYDLLKDGSIPVAEEEYILTTPENYKSSARVDYTLTVQEDYTPVSRMNTTPFPWEDTTPMSPVDTTPLSPVDTTPLSPVDTTPLSPVDTTPLSPVDTTPLSPVDTTPLSPVDTTPLSPVDTPPCPGRRPPKLKKALKNPGNIKEFSNDNFLKENIKIKGIVNPKLLSNPFFGPMVEFIKYFSKKFKDKCNYEYNFILEYKTGMRLIYRLENFSYKQMQERCDIFFKRESWWSRENNYTLGAFLCDNIFNTLIPDCKEKKTNTDSGVPYLTKENYYEITGVKKYE
jgi:hypothetical protein